jgi:ferredoxin
VTVEVPENLAVTYKYINGNDWPEAELVPFECGVNDGFGGYNRNIVTNNTDITLPIVCFSSCASCILNVEEGQISSGLLVYPNPADETITITGLKADSNLAIFDVTGKMVLQRKINSDNFTMNISDLNHGIYTLRDLSTKTSTRLLVR